MTNYENIKSMSVEEMAEEIDYILNKIIASYTDQCDICPATNVCNRFDSCQDSIKHWLESEVTE